jgi:asparagine synthase (glutamine-hydrolysing)
VSGIYGIFRFDGAPVEPETLRRMREAMAYYGPDGGGEWREGHVGLGQLLLCVTPEDRFESQPLTADGISLVAAARLDNRDDLLREFGIPPAEFLTTADSSLVLEAYRKWGEDCPDHLNGDWQFAAWNGRQRTLFMARDHHGNTGLYYYQNSRFIAFASSLKALLALPEAPRRPDMLKMAQVLASWPGEGWRTAYEEMRRLPPAHTMRATANGTDIKRYWFPENLPTVRLSKDEEYVERFLEIYGEAVRVRLRCEGPVGVSLSGGLDSGSVTALAAPLLAAEGKTLTAITSVPAHEASGAASLRLGDEWPLAAATAKMAGDNIAHLPLMSEGASVLAAMERKIELQDGPGHAAGNSYWIMDLLGMARSHGIRTMLTGQCGNATVSCDGSGMAVHYLLKGEFSAGVRALCRMESSPWQTLKRQILRPMLLPGLSRYRHHLKGKGNPWQDYSAIAPGFARAIQLGTLMRDNGHDPAFTMPSSPRQQLAILMPGSSTLGANWHESGAGFGMEVRDPTIDRRVIEFCLRTPDDQFRRKGEGRWLILRAMAGRMPDEVLYCRQKGLQAADLGHRVVRERNAIRGALDHAGQSETARSCLDLDRMGMVLSALEQTVDATTTQQCSIILLRGLGVGLFLARF